MNLLEFEIRHAFTAEWTHQAYIVLLGQNYCQVSGLIEASSQARKG